MNRIRSAFKEKKLFIPFVTAGYPDVESFVELVVLLAEEGAGVIEIGVPFSDPVADGKVIQAASQKVLDAGMNVEQVFELVKEIRKRTDVPLILMSYYNLLLYKGLDDFIKKCKEAGVDGLIVPDLLFEEMGDLKKACGKGIGLINFICPTTSDERAQLIMKQTSGFVYYVSRMGVTGVGGMDMSKIKQRLNELKAMGDVPIALGFGVSQPKEAKDIYALADGVIMGSALLQKADECRDKSNFYDHMREFVRPFIQ